MNKKLVSLLAVLCGFFILNAADIPGAGLAGIVVGEGFTGIPVDARQGGEDDASSSSESPDRSQGAAPEKLSDSAKGGPKPPVASSAKSQGDAPTFGQRIIRTAEENLKQFAATTKNSLRHGAEIARTQFGNVGGTLSNYFDREGKGPGNFWTDAEALTDSAVEGAQGFAEGVGYQVSELSDDIGMMAGLIESPETVEKTQQGYYDALNGKKASNPKNYPVLLQLEEVFVQQAKKDLSEAAKKDLEKKFAAAEQARAEYEDSLEKAAGLAEEVAHRGTPLQQLQYGGLSALVAGGGAYAAERALEHAFGLDAKDYKRSTVGEATYAALLTAVSQWATQQSRLIALAKDSREKAYRRKNFYRSMLLIASLFGGGDFVSRLFSDAKKGEGPTTWSARLSSAAKRFLTAMGAMAGGSVLSHAANNEHHFSPLYDTYVGEDDSSGGGEAGSSRAARATAAGA